MPFFEAVKTCFRKYATFKCRAPRSEFWWFMLFNFLAASGLSIIGNVIGNQETGNGLVGLYQLGVLLPTWAVLCRRLHDTNRTGWWLIVPVALAIVWLICSAIAFAGKTSALAIIWLFFMVTAMAVGSESVAFFGLLFGVAALIAAIAFLAFCCLAGTQGPNKYGPDPLEDTNQCHNNASNHSN